MERSKDTNQKWAKIVAKAWEDEAFKKELLAHPTRILKEHGLADFGGKKNCKILENTSDTVYLVIPEKPKQKLSTAELEKIAAAGSNLDRLDMVTK